MDDVESWVEPFFNAYRSEILHRNVLEGSIAEAEREADREVPAFALPAVKRMFQRLRMRVDAQSTKLLVCYARRDFSPPPFEDEDEYHFTVARYTSERFLRVLNGSFKLRLHFKPKQRLSDIHRTTDSRYDTNPQD